MRQQFWLRGSVWSPRLWIQDQSNLQDPVVPIAINPLVQYQFRKGKFWKPQLALFVDQSSHYNYMTLSVLETTVPIMVRNVTKVESVVETTAPKMVRDVAITRTVVETASVMLPKTVTRLMVVLETASPSMTRAVTKLLTLTETTSPAMVKAVTRLLTVVETASPKTQRAVARLLSVVETTNPSTIRAITKIVSTLETTAPLMKRDITKFLKTLETTAPTLNGSKSFLVTLLAVVNSITSITTSTKKGTKIVPVIHRGGGTTRDGAQPVDRESERQANDAKAERNRKAIMRAHDLEVQIGQALLRGDVNLALVLMAERNDILEAIGYFK